MALGFSEIIENIKTIIPPSNLEKKLLFYSSLKHRIDKREIKDISKNK